jgi:hypothetical protein
MADSSQMAESLARPGYDSAWMRKFLAARETIAQAAPAKSELFSRSFDALRTNRAFKSKQFKPLIPADQLDELRQIAKCIPRDRLEFHELKRFGRLVVHNYPAFAAIHAQFAPLVAEWAGEAVEPAYNFLAMYTRRGACEPHLDSPSAKWTLDICIAQSDPWPIQFSQIVPWPEEAAQLGQDWQAQAKSLPGLSFEAVTLMPGDAVLFAGSSQWHYRDAMPGRTAKSFCDLLFLHYIPKGTAEIVEPKNWARLFDVPELASIPGIGQDEL